MTIEPPLYAEIVEFWKAAGPKTWFAHDDAFDQEIRQRFEAVHMAASRGEFADWADEAESCLALLLLLDQFPRNLYRGSAHAYATDALARAVAHSAQRPPRCSRLAAQPAHSAGSTRSTSADQVPTSVQEERRGRRRRLLARGG